MAGRLGHVKGADGNDTRRYFPRRNPSFAGYDQIPHLPPPPTYDLPASVYRRYVANQGRMWEITSPNSLQNTFCPGIRPANLNLRVRFFEEQHRRYDGHMGPFDPTRNAQLWLPGKEWRALIMGPAAGNPRKYPEYEVATNCWKSDAAPAFDTGRIHNSYIDKLILQNQEVGWRMEVLHKEYVKHHFLEPSHRALWSAAIRPAIPTSEDIDSLQATPFWMPDADAEVAMADDCYLGVWLNGAEERQARWYLKEGIPCFVVREVTSLERVLLAARETVIDFAAGTSTSSIHWTINDYDSMAISRGDLSLSDTAMIHDPGWVWPQAVVNRRDESRSPDTKSADKSVVDYGPPPLETISIASDRVPWIKPPPVKKAAASRANAPAHERKRWIKFVENYDPKGSFKEVGAKNAPVHRTHSMYDREKRWHLFFLRPPKIPEGCVSDPSIFGQPCPKGVYKGINKKQFVQPRWIYQTMEPQPTDVGRKAPVPRPEELPPLRKPSQPNPPPNDDSDSDNDYYPDEGDQAPPVLNVIINADVSSVSVTTTPAAQITGIEPTVQAIEIQPAAIGATSGVGEATTEPASIDPNLSLPKTNHMQEDDEISWGDDEHNHDVMGLQIPPLSFMVDSEINTEAVTPADPLEFASSFMLYGIPTSEEFPVIQDMIMQENGIELRVAYADYEDYVGALTRASHRWPDTLSNNGSQGPSSLQSVAPAVSSSSRRWSSGERRQTHDNRRRSPSMERYRVNRRLSPLPRRQSPSHSTYRRRYQRSPSPRRRARSPYRRSRSPGPRSYRPPGELATRPSREQENASPLTLRNSNADAMIHIPPLPVLPGMPAFAGLPHNAPLPFGANVAFMWSPSGNTFSPVLLQGNTTVLPYPMAPTGPTPSALLPWPVAAALPTLNVPPSSLDTSRGSSTASLASRISAMVELRSDSPPPTPARPTLMSRMTDQLSARLTDPAPPAALAARLTAPGWLTLADRLETADPMVVDHSPYLGSAALADFSTESLHPATASGSSSYHQAPMDEDPTDQGDDGEEDYKRTKRGRRSGQKIQGYRKRDEEREERKRRRRRR
ncbi:uncharacterized protein LACBIDRAFT_328877 [Laccaria bicolor S238N-H82]|uniref:Predicted protein n=1 Tax=Laccaria bicolor (strain S238N-H82 / ATCC MYA-4686) TaxID=486041 RepID=B0DG99_LACBS|nr:uncharacterized protein LACBIDRAFT_328877 [Laccaria bicolor S238N-H82]EDR06478.1 predicted protein [Laccaria bicolor S238N-H82]|eukprot:XP_001882850.1 predicted protein [Laccaria bicolor S238N-H82]